MKRVTAAMLMLALTLGALQPAHVSAASDAVKLRMEQMTLRDKITQMLMIDLQSWDENTADGGGADFTVMNSQTQKFLEEYRFGAVIYFARNLTDTQQAFELTQAIQQAARRNGGIPMLICADQEGGSVYRLATGTALPGNMVLGASGSVDYAKLAGRIIGSELSALGINANLAPVVDVNSNANNPVIGLRSFSDDPQTVGSMAAAMIAGMGQFDVVGCAKHFPGHGDTETDSHYGLPTVDKSLQQLETCELVPFRIAIGQGIDMIMTAHILYPQLEQEKVLSRKTGQSESLPATMSPRIITELLKEEMGFEGIVVTDAMNMAGIAEYWDPVQAVILAIQAGADMICMPCSVHSLADIPKLEEILRGVEAAVQDGTIPQNRIDDAVRRILTVKEKRGILDWTAEEKSLAGALMTVGGEANREAERHIAAAGVTVVRNDNRVLPLRITPESRVLMLVPYDNEKAQMILGWNRAAQAGLIPEGAQVQVMRFGKDTTLETYREALDWADTVIFNSEISSVSRMNGGRWESAYILMASEYAKNHGKTVIVQSVDKPYDVQSYPNADAVVAVYGCKGSTLDPTEALVGGVTGSRQAFGPNIVAGIEVILGVFDANGTLPVDIPKLENGAYTEEILYPRGYGLHYESLLPDPVIPEPETEAEMEPVTQPWFPETSLPEKQDTQASCPDRWLLWAAAAVMAGGTALLAAGKRKRRRRKKRRR